MGIWPIVSSCDSITEKYPNLLTNGYSHMLETYPHRLKIQQNLLTKSKLYTNIPHEEGVQSALHFLKTINPEGYRYLEQPNLDIQARNQTF